MFQVTWPFSQLSPAPRSITERFRCGQPRDEAKKRTETGSIAAKTIRSTSASSGASIRHRVQRSCPCFGRDIHSDGLTWTVAGEQHCKSSIGPKRVWRQHALELWLY